MDKIEYQPQLKDLPEHNSVADGNVPSESNGTNGVNASKSKLHQTDDKQALIDDLGLCTICHLRIWSRETFGKDLEKYHSELKNGIADAEAKKRKENPCSLCLGLLTIDNLELCIVSIKSILASEKYKQENSKPRNTCDLSLSLPPALFIRERALKIYLTEHFEGLLDLDRRSAFITLKEAWKMSLQHLLEGSDIIFDSNCPLMITFNICYNGNIEECEKLALMNSSCFPNIKKKNATPDDIYSRKSVQIAVDSAPDWIFKKYVTVPPQIPSASVSVMPTPQHAPVFLAGRYNKYSRNLSQTPWILQGERKTDSSIEELICGPIKALFKPSAHNFSSSGREDVDVRMLGTGRPFVIELIDPGTDQFLFERFRELEKEINSDGRVQVRDLQIVSKEEVKQLKEGEEDKKKTYRALCIAKVEVSSDRMSEVENSGIVTLLQKTPMRVLHRRPLAVRKRAVEDIKFQKLEKKLGEDFLYSLEVTTQAGTYVKEFVHGDFGRTTPNLSAMLGVDVDIVALDVQSIHLDWPPPIMQ